MSKSGDKRLREGALSALRTPENPPEPPTLTPVEAEEEEAQDIPAGDAGSAKSYAEASPKVGSGGADPNPEVVREAIAFAQEGDAKGLQTLYSRYADDVRRYAASFVGDQREAEDITQTVFARLATSIGRYEQREVPFNAWLLRVARNASLDHMRARAAIPTEEVRVVDTGRAQTGLDQGQALRQALEDLPEDQREVLVLRHIVGLSPLEIAGTLERSETAVLDLDQVARELLRSQFRVKQSAIEELLQE